MGISHEIRIPLSLYDIQVRGESREELSSRLTNLVAQLMGDSGNVEEQLQQKFHDDNVMQVLWYDDNEEDVEHPPGVGLGEKLLLLKSNSDHFTLLDFLYEFGKQIADEGNFGDHHYLEGVALDKKYNYWHVITGN